MLRSWWAFLVLAVVGLSAGELRGQETTPLVLTTKSGVYRFAVEFADTPDRRARGLMFRRSLPENGGMLFDFERSQPITMWMQNTPLSLDMVFIRADGTVARVEQGATPFSTATIASGEPVRAVLEVLAGTARRIGLSRGDRVQHAIFGNAP